MNLLAAALLAVSAVAESTPARPAAVLIEAVLDNWHDAAAKADFNRYFGHFADDGVFIGTDPGERWTVSAFKAYAKPHFDKGQAWTLVPKSRNVAVSADGNTAWFDERVDSPKYGINRGTGVLVKTKAGWKIAQYSYSLPIPNDHFMDVLKVIQAPPAKK
jgi:ketosteroid isomerase-like protein